MFPFYWALQDPKLGRFKTDFLLLGVDGELILLMDSSGEKKCTYYGAFHKHANSEVQKPTDDCVFRRFLNFRVRMSNIITKTK